MPKKTRKNGAGELRMKSPEYAGQTQYDEISPVPATCRTEDGRDVKVLNIYLMFQQALPLLLAMFHACLRANRYNMSLKAARDNVCVLIGVHLDTHQIVVLTKDKKRKRRRASNHGQMELFS